MTEVRLNALIDDANTVESAGYRVCTVHLDDLRALLIDAKAMFREQTYIAAQLALLSNPVEGMNVTGEGFEWYFYAEDESADDPLLFIDIGPNQVLAERLLPTLIALVKSGGARVEMPAALSPQGEEGRGA